MGGSYSSHMREEKGRSPVLVLCVPPKALPNHYHHTNHRADKHSHASRQMHGGMSPTQHHHTLEENRPGEYLYFLPWWFLRVDALSKIEPYQVVVVVLRDGCKLQRNGDNPSLIFCAYRHYVSPSLQRH